MRQFQVGWKQNITGTSVEPPGTAWHGPPAGLCGMMLTMIAMQAPAAGRYGTAPTAGADGAPTDSPGPGNASGAGDAVSPDYNGSQVNEAHE